MARNIAARELAIGVDYFWFCYFLLLDAYDSIAALDYEIDRLTIGYRNYNLLKIPYNILLASYFIFVINLIIHVLLRGLWISTIGLRYVSGDIDFDQFRFIDKFDRFLRKRIGSFDSSNSNDLSRFKTC